MTTTYSPRIKPWEITSQYGFRHNGANDSFRLTLDQLVEYEKNNDKIVDNEEFWDWVDEFIKREGLKAEVSTSYGRGSTPVWSGGSKKSYKGKHLSSWWAEDVHSGFSWWGNTDSTGATKLALAMKAVRGVIRIIDDTVPPMVVNWADENISYTDFEHGHIYVNPSPVTKAKTEDDDGEAIDIATGFALHEASHSQHSRPFANELLLPQPMRPIRVAGVLWNIVEDQRIEDKTSESFPGFAPYFEKLMEWLAKESKGHLPKTWDKAPLQDKINAVLAIVRFPGKARLEMTHPSFDPEFIWWTDWKNDYISGKTDTRTTLANALARLESDPDTKAEMDALTAEEEVMEKGLTPNEIKELAKKLVEEMKKRGIKSCSSSAREPKDNLKNALADEVRKLLEEDLTKDQPFIPRKSEHGVNPTIFISKPVETSHSMSQYVGKPSPVLQRLRAALRFRQELPQYSNRLLKSGALDGDELWRWKVGDYRVFEETIIEARPKSQFTLLVDLSGSMRGSKLTTAQELAQLFVLALRDMDGVDMKVFGHTANVHSDTDCQVYRIWEPGDAMTRIGLIATLPHHNNYDGYAIDACIKDILNRGLETEQRVIVVLSDGWPSGSNYGGGAGENHVRYVTNWAEQHGVQVIQIAIDPEMDSERQGRMFRHWISYTDTQSLPRKLEKLLDKLTS